MNFPNRDLLILFNQELMTPQAIEYEIERIHEILYNVERIDNLAISHEAFDLNRYKVIQKRPILLRVLRSRELKPFVFLNCRN